MSLTSEAVYENGCLKLAQPLPFKEQEKVRIIINPPVSRARLTAGLMGWQGSIEDANRFATDPDLAFPSPRETP